jgi:DNA repair ATPase RecN
MGEAGRIWSKMEEGGLERRRDTKPWELRVARVSLDQLREYQNQLRECLKQLRECLNELRECQTELRSIKPNSVV